MFKAGYTEYENESIDNIFKFYKTDEVFVDNAWKPVSTFKVGDFIDTDEGKKLIKQIRQETSTIILFC